MYVQHLSFVDKLKDGLFIHTDLFPLFEPKAIMSFNSIITWFVGPCLNPKLPKWSNFGL